MIFLPKSNRSGYWRGKLRRGILLAAVAVAACPAAGRALPARLVLALDGIAYRDLQALQAGITRTNFWGKPVQLRAFTAEEGYFPVSRMVSTFPSASDVAWTDIFGDRPLPGYQRTYFSTAANAVISLNGVTSSMEHERQMNWQVNNGFLRAMGYLFPVHTYEYELRGMADHFWQATHQTNNYYVYLRASDDAQHMERDITTLLCELDQLLQNMRARYQASEGHDLQIVILSDHGHNHAGRGQRVAVRAFLEAAGYRPAETIASPKDVVLPTVGVETWVEVHSAPDETERLATRLCQLPGVDVLAASVPDQPNRFLVMNSKSERAVIDWNPAKNSFRYTPVQGDPIDYRPMTEALARMHQVDADGFATADDWMAATITHHYPLALERIVRGFARNTLNPATILISLDNQYVNESWLVQQGSRLVTCGSTHGGLDDINSDGILLCNFTPTQDTSTHRVAGQFADFPRVKDFRAEENGAEWVTKKEQARVRITRDPFDQEFTRLPDDDVCLRIWSPQLAGLDHQAPLEVTLEKFPRYVSAHFERGNHQPEKTARPPLGLKLTAALPDTGTDERVYLLPPELRLEPQTEYKITGGFSAEKQTDRLFEFTFRTGRNGRPLAY